MGISEDTFGEFVDPDGVKHTIRRFTLTSASGVEVSLISYGAGVSAIKAPDKTGHLDYVTLGFDQFKKYTEFNYIGSSIGRHGNRICKGKFHLEGKDYDLTINNGNNHNHGGKRGWDKYVWEATSDEDTVIFSHMSPEGDQGYPGGVIAQVKYNLSDDGELRIEFSAMSTQATPINMTNHSFFNLAGHSSGKKGLYEHVFKVNADRFLPVTEELIPTGELSPVTKTAFDLRSPTLLSEALAKVPGGGYDHCFSLQNKKRGELEFAAQIQHPPSGRYLEVYTTEPGLQIYTGNFLPQEEGIMVGQDGHSYMYQGAFCAEPQNFPDAINKPGIFPDGVLRPGKSYSHTIVYKFVVQK